MTDARGEPAAAPRRRPVIWTLVKVAVTAAMIYFLYTQIDLAELWEAASAVDARWLLVAMAQMLITPLIGGARWLLVLGAMGERDRWWPITRLFWIGMLFSQVLPSQVGGDAIRMLLARWRGHSLSVAINSVMIERILMVVVLVVLVACLLPFATHRLGMQPSVSWTVILLLAGAFVGVIVLVSADKIPFLAGLLSKLSKSGAGKTAMRLPVDARKVLLSPSAVLQATLAVLPHLNQVMCAFWIGRAVGLQLDFVDYLAIVPFIFISTLLPISIGGWGVREGVSVALFGFVGVASSQALLLSLFLGAAVVAASLPALPMWWIDSKRKPVSTPEP